MRKNNPEHNWELIHGIFRKYASEKAKNRTNSELAEFYVRSVLKKIRTLQNNDSKSIGGRYTEQLENPLENNEKASKLNKNGKKIEKKVFKAEYLDTYASELRDYTKRAEKLKNQLYLDNFCSESDTLSDASDLKQSALLAICEIERALLLSRPNLSLDDTITVLKPSKKVIYDTKTAYCFSDVKARSIVLQAVRREYRIGYSSRHYVGKFTYNQIDSEIYLREKPLVEINSVYEHETQESIIESLNLSTRQRQILTYRLQGYGYKAIATKLSIDPSTVKTQLKRIQQKYLEMDKNEQ